jgi:hypothetical protein
VNHRGRPLRGAIAGFFLGLFLSLDLLIFGVVALDADILAVLPVLGLLAGLALGLTAPLHRGRPAAAVEPATEPLQVDVAPIEAHRPESAPAMTAPESDRTPA